ncbi:MAG: Zn-ribbon domain-containing OB-fold protein [Planctomycetota bacterium]|nr:Zn-ribbon domain-containing OB-fold protein [Planctomycetota bacterium]
MSILHSLKTGDPGRAKEGDFPVESLYTAGIAGEKFLTALRDRGVLLASRCEACSVTTLLARAFCEKCLSPTDSYPEVKGAGEVKTYTLLRRDLDGNPIDPPEILAFVVFEGVEGGVIHRLDEVAADEVKVGLRVEMVLRKQAEREGSILDLSHFRPVSTASGR